MPLSLAQIQCSGNPAQVSWHQTCCSLPANLACVCFLSFSFFFLWRSTSYIFHISHSLSRPLLSPYLFSPNPQSLSELLRAKVSGSVVSWALLFWAGEAEVPTPSLNTIGSYLDEAWHFLREPVSSNCHNKLGGFKYEKWILSFFWRPESEIKATAWLPPVGACRGESFLSSFFLVSLACGHISLISASVIMLLPPVCLILASVFLSQEHLSFDWGPSR